ncbi:hypothetical protein ACOSQ2_003790 [Xanthoceras sorbifolium]
MLDPKSGREERVVKDDIEPMVNSRMLTNQREVVSVVSKNICRDSEVSSGSIFKVISGRDLEVQYEENEVSSPKRKRWKRLARGRNDSVVQQLQSNNLGKRVLFETDYVATDEKRARLVSKA